MKGKGTLKLLAAAVVIAAAVFVAVAGIGAAKSGSASNVKLGLDLAGGVSITYETVKDDPTDTEMADTVYKMQKRAEGFSTEAQVYPEGDRRITVSIPDVTDADQVLADLGDAGNIYFIYGMSNKGVANIVANGYGEDGHIKYVLARPLDEIIADGDVVIDGSDITDAQPNIYQDKLKGTENLVVLTLNDRGRNKFATATRYCYSYYNDTSDGANLKRIIAIVYDGEVINAPSVAAEITDGVATISGETTFDGAKQLATTIRIGALPLELSVLRLVLMLLRLA